MNDIVVDVQKVSKSFGNEQVLKDVSLQEEALKQENQALKAKVEEKKRKGLEEQLREVKLEHDYRERRLSRRNIHPEDLNETLKPLQTQVNLRAEQKDVAGCQENIRVLTEY